MKYLKLFEWESSNDTWSILFVPSGELLEVSIDEFTTLSDNYVTFDWSQDNKCFYIEDHYKEAIIMALNYKSTKYK